MQHEYTTPELVRLGQFRDLTRGSGGGKAWPATDLVPGVGADSTDDIGCTYESNGKAGCIFS